MHALLRDAGPPLTRSVEDYLKAIYHLSNQGGFAATSDIAAMLEVAPPSVSGMVKRLSETGLIEHVPYRGVQLTAQGRRAALKMIRRHRILELYLVQHLGYDWGGVHAEAERPDRPVAVGRAAGGGTRAGAGLVVPRGPVRRVWPGRSLSETPGGGVRASPRASPRRIAASRSMRAPGGGGRSRSRARAIWSPWATWIRATGRATWREARRLATRCSASFSSRI